MSAPILSIKQIKAKFQKYQIIALICSVITVVAFVLATVSSSLLAERSKKLAAVSAQQQLSQNELQNQVNSANDRHRQFESMKSELSDTQARLLKKQDTIKLLNNKIEALEKEIFENSSMSVLPVE